MKVQPYLNFDGRCDEAITFYKRALDAELTALMRFKECPDTGISPGSENKVMHAALRIGESVIFVSDGRNKGQSRFEGVALSLSVENEAEAEQKFAALADGGQVQMPLAKTFFSPRFGMVADRFGVGWMVIVAQ